MYRLAFEEDKRLVVATLEGFWTLDTLARYSAELAALLRKVRAKHNFCRMLARSADMPIQSPEVAEAFGPFTEELTALCPGPIAITVGTMLNKMQASRALAHERIRVFGDEMQARDWLMSIEEGD